MLKQIIAREFKVLLHAKAQIIGMLLVVLMIIGAGVAGNYFMKRDSEEDSKPAEVIVALAPEMKDFEQALDGTGLIDATVIEAQTDYGKWLKSENEKEGDTPSLVLIGAPDKPEIIKYGDNSENEIAIQVIQQSATMMQVNGITGGINQAEAEKLSSAMNIPVTLVTGSSNLIGENPIGFFTALIAQFFIFFAVVTGISSLSTGVVEEKSSRVVEILLSSVRPRTLLLGKILGIGAFILLQLVIYLVAGIFSLKIAGLWQNFEFNSLIVWCIMWILLGFFTYISITGGISAMVSRQEDLGAIITPLIFFMLIPFYLGMYLVPALPNHITTKVFSMIPGFSSFMMPVRQAYSSVDTWELVLAAGINLVCIPLLAVLAGKIYENSILRMGRRVTFRQALSGK